MQAEKPHTRLSKELIGSFDNASSAPGPDYFRLPEKVLQFGTGVLLRGLPDYFIDQANKKGVFNGRILVVKSTDSGGEDAFAIQDNLYTQCIRGIRDGSVVQQDIVNAAISRVVVAKTAWPEILQAAANEALQLVISNTTEVGLALVHEDIHAGPPHSFPGKLTAVLYERFKVFAGDPSKGLIIIPTELIPGNGDKLRSIVLSLAEYNRLEPAFINWLETANDFCNSLVDRIVPGKPDAAQKKAVEAALGYEDDLMIISEVYSLWAIEAANPRVKEVLSFAAVNDSVVIAPDITNYRELKLRLLNGSHTFSAALAHLAGFETVRDAMADASFFTYISGLMVQEIAVSITNDHLSLGEAREFAAKVLDRYRNPFIEHRWLSITMQYSSKMHIRNIAAIKQYVMRLSAPPARMALGFAGYLLFSRSVETKDGKYFGTANGSRYHVNDDRAGYFYEVWARSGPEQLVDEVLANRELWGEDLGTIPGFADLVKRFVAVLIANGARAVLHEMASKAIPEQADL